MSRRRVRWTIASVVLIAVAVVAWRWGQPVWQQAALLYRQHQAMTFVLADATVVLEDHPEQAMKLLEDRLNYRQVRAESPTVIRTTPAALQSVTVGSGRFGYVASGRRTTPAGEPTFVTVHQGAVANENSRCIYLLAEVFEPAGWRPGSRRASIGTGGCLLQVPAATRLRLFAGTPDLVDPSKLIIPYEIDGRRGGRLEVRVSNIERRRTCGNGGVQIVDYRGTQAGE